MRRRMTLAVLAAGAVLGAAACGQNQGNGGDEPQSGASGPAPGATAGATAPPAPPLPPDGDLGSRELQDQGHELLLEITGLRRQGQTVTLTWRVIVTKADEAEFDLGWRVAHIFANGNQFNVGAVTLVDPVNAQRYLVARSGGEDGQCACTRGTNIWLKEGDSAEFFANFSAPPPEVTIINVEFPRFGAFTDVPIS